MTEIAIAHLDSSKISSIENYVAIEHLVWFLYQRVNECNNRTNRSNYARLQMDSMVQIH